MLILLKHYPRNLEDHSLSFTVADSGERIGDFGAQYMLRILASRGRLTSNQTEVTSLSREITSSRYPPRVALPPQKANQIAEPRIFRRPIR